MFDRLWKRLWIKVKLAGERQQARQMLEHQPASRQAPRSWRTRASPTRTSMSPHRPGPRPDADPPGPQGRRRCPPDPELATAAGRGGAPGDGTEISWPRGSGDPSGVARMSNGSEHRAHCDGAPPITSSLPPTEAGTPGRCSQLSRNRSGRALPRAPRAPRQRCRATLSRRQPGNGDLRSRFLAAQDPHVQISQRLASGPAHGRRAGPDGRAGQPGRGAEGIGSGQVVAAAGSLRPTPTGSPRTGPGSG